MKNNYFISLQKGFLALMSVALLFSCSQIEPFEMEGNDKVLLSVVSPPVTKAFPSSEPNCDAPNCLILGEAVTFTKVFNSGELTEGVNKKVVTATVSLIINADNMAYYKVDYASQRTGGRSNEDVVISGSLNGQAFGTTGKWNTTNPVSGTFSTTPLFDYTTIECGDTFNFTFNESSKAANVNWNENIAQLAYCQDDCEDEFSAVLECDEEGKTLTVTFTAEEAGDYVIQGGLTNGTTIVSRTADADFNENTTHPGVVNSNANVTRWEGTLDACETVTIIIKYTGGAGVGSWSAKSVVDGVEVTNGESDDQDCPGAE